MIHIQVQAVNCSLRFLKDQPTDRKKHKPAANLPSIRYTYKHSAMPLPIVYIEPKLAS
jgi:hypothetical protein